MSLLETFPDITQSDQPLAPLTWMKVGGLAQFTVQPRGFDELQEVITYCSQLEIPVRLLGGGSNVLVRDEGVERLPHATFTLRSRLDQVVPM